MKKWILAGILFGSTMGAAAHVATTPTPEQMVIRPHLMLCGHEVTTPQFVSSFFATPELVEQIMVLGGGDVYFHAESGVDHYNHKGRGRGICV